MKSTSYTPTDNFFLEPPHSHDPTKISHIAALPSSMLANLPEAVQDALWTLQESTSVVYASFFRLQALLDERFERLTPLSSMDGSYSETSFFNYTNALAAERAYLLEDAHPDWKHKARQASLLFQSSPISLQTNTDQVSQWMSQLHTAESLWIQSARSAEIPNFEDTVLEHQSLSESESISPTPSEMSCFSEDEDISVNKPVSATRKLPADVVKPESRIMHVG